MSFRIHQQHKLHSRHHNDGQAVPPPSINPNIGRVLDVVRSVFPKFSNGFEMSAIQPATCMNKHRSMTRNLQLDRSSFVKYDMTHPYLGYISQKTRGKQIWPTNLDDPSFRIQGRDVAYGFQMRGDRLRECHIHDKTINTLIRNPRRRAISRIRARQAGNISHRVEFGIAAQLYCSFT